LSVVSGQSSEAGLDRASPTNQPKPGQPKWRRNCSSLTSSANDRAGGGYPDAQESGSIDASVRQGENAADNRRRPDRIARQNETAQASATQVGWHVRAISDSGLPTADSGADIFAAALQGPGGEPSGFATERKKGPTDFTKPLSFLPRHSRPDIGTTPWNCGAATTGRSCEG
jgi:hypothetical protein